MPSQLFLESLPHPSPLSHYFPTGGEEFPAQIPACAPLHLHSFKISIPAPNPSSKAAQVVKKFPQDIAWIRSLSPKIYLGVAQCWCHRSLMAPDASVRSRIQGKGASTSENNAGSSKPSSGRETKEFPGIEGLGTGVQKTLCHEFLFPLLTCSKIQHLQGFISSG